MSCDALFNQELIPGTTYRAVVTIRNEGQVPAELLQLWAIGPCTSGASNSSFSGTANLCSATWITIHDDAHDFCYFPVRAAGACQLGVGGTIVDLANRNGPNNPINLAVDQLASGIPHLRDRARSCGRQRVPGPEGGLQPHLEGLPRLKATALTVG